MRSGAVGSGSGETNQVDAPRAVLAVDIGGTQVRAALVDAQARILRRLAEPVRDPSDGEALTVQVMALTGRVAGSAGMAAGPATGAVTGAQSKSGAGSTVRPTPAPVALGLSVPAVLDRRAGRVEWAPNLPGWDGVPLASRLAEQIGIPAVLEYDGHAAVLGEHWAGAAQGVEDVAFVIVGTGVGGGILSGGRLLRGATNLAGAGGWMAVPTGVGGPAGAAGPDPEAARTKGFLEALVAGPALAAAASRLLGRPVTPRDLFDGAAAGDEGCRKVVALALQHLGYGLANIVSLVNPQLVLLGGSVGLRFAEYAGELEEAIRRHAQPWSARAVRVAPAALGGDAGLLGAACSAFEAAGAQGAAGKSCGTGSPEKASFRKARFGEAGCEGTWTQPRAT